MSYLDYNASQPPNKNILNKCLEHYFEFYANSSGLSAFSQEIDQKIHSIRNKLANFFHVNIEQIIFTSSATESNSLALWLINQYISTKKKIMKVLCSPLEHPSIMETLNSLPNIEIQFIPLKKNSQVDLDFIHHKIKEGTISAIIVMAVHNETGIIQPIKEILNIIKTYPNCFFVSDMVQLLPKIYKDTPTQILNLCNFENTNDIPGFYSFSSHKIGAGFGTGVLIVPNTINWTPYKMITGGSQEYELRAGSHNLFSILSFGEVLAEQINKEYYTILENNTQSFENFIQNELQRPIVGNTSQRLPGTSLCVFQDINIDFLLMGLDQKKITVSTGTSCKSKSRTASQGLLAMGLTQEDTLQVIRFSYNYKFSPEIQKYTQNTLKALYTTLRT